jgi:cAMP phosphodiesterase
MRTTKKQLRRIISERMAPQMGKNTGGFAYISDMDQEMIDYLEKELGTSNFFDEVMERIPQKQLSSILRDIAKEYGFVIGGVKRL